MRTFKKSANGQCVLPPQKRRVCHQLLSCCILFFGLPSWNRKITYLLHGAESFLQLVKKLPAFHRTRRFIIALTSVHHLSLSWASLIQSIYPHPTSCRSIIILSTHLCLSLPSGLLPSGFPTKTLHTPSPHSYAPHAQPISFFLILSPAHYWMRSTDHLAPRYAVSSIPPLPCPSLVQIFSSTPCSQTPSATFPPAMSATKIVSLNSCHVVLSFQFPEPLKLGLIVCPETSVWNYHSILPPQSADLT